MKTTATSTSTSTPTSTPTPTSRAISRSGRVTATLDGDYVVFLIGMRVNAWWKPWRYLPVVMAMPRMLRELGQDPDLGFLGGESFFGRTTLMVQYWRSNEHLHAFARSATSTHLPAWKEFYSAARGGDVGIWHETYPVRAGDYENVYVAMPAFGLGKVGAIATPRRHEPRDAARAEDIVTPEAVA